MVADGVEREKATRRETQAVACLFGGRLSELNGVKLTISDGRLVVESFCAHRVVEWGFPLLHVHTPRRTVFAAHQCTLSATSDLNMPFIQRRSLLSTRFHDTLDPIEPTFKMCPTLASSEKKKTMTIARFRVEL
uniref:Uncharacterized protein n=1 Tax=Erythrolobus madagascarensis TaxID=708628 RepID=A0A7S0XMI9_9RHOD|mmetsp:Transcript_2256/g.5079  ORF Transcript_2256/g.5079 Transcript_2256/m.5079 type:complete len:134 (+) Transcript_2256:300-701(+)